MSTTTLNGCDWLSYIYTSCSFSHTEIVRGNPRVVEELCLLPSDLSSIGNKALLSPPLPPHLTALQGLHLASNSFPGDPF